MRVFWRSLVGLALVASVALVPEPSGAHHPDHGGAAGGEMFPGEGVIVDGGKQHDGEDGHLPPVNRNVRLVGKAEVTNPSGAGNDGRVADVFAYKNHAYLNTYYLPTCEQTGVHVVDISDPANPFEVESAFIPTSPGSFTGEGIQVIPMSNRFFTGDLLIHQNESFAAFTGCGEPPEPHLAGGVSLWNVTDPTSPQPVTLHTGDFTNDEGGLDPSPNETHSMYAWSNTFDGRTYVVLVDDEEATNVDILDITDPFHPVMVNDTLDLAALFGVDQPTPDVLVEVFSHDMVVQRVGQRYVMNMNYWDGGYVLLDVTDPRPGRVTLISESDYAALDEERLSRGHEFAPEGNSHQSELSPNRKFLLGTDEDFDPYTIEGTIDSGPYVGTTYDLIPAPDMEPFDEETDISGPTTFVGTACEELPAGTGTAVVERGTCTFQVKLDMITEAGYSAGIVFNALRPDCMFFINMLAEGTIPYAFVDRLTGLQLLGVDGVTDHNACETPGPAAGSPSAATTVNPIFDGWGYVRLFGTDIPAQRGKAGSIKQIDTYAVPESQDADYAYGFGDLSVHEVAMDPDESIAYISYYSAGFRVVRYGKTGIQEIGAFIDEGGNNFWGVEVWRHGDGTKYVLASDRDFGLYIFQYAP